MKRSERLWIPVLLGVLLIATLAGAASARPSARPLEQPWRVLTVGSHACIPADGYSDWDHHDPYVECDTGWCWFVCPLNFPAAGEQAVGAINVKRLTMYVYDYDGTGQDSEVWLAKTYPLNASTLDMAHVATLGSSTTNPQVLIDTSIDGNPVWRTQSPYLFLNIQNSSNIRVYGFFVHYTW